MQSFVMVGRWRTTPPPPPPEEGIRLVVDVVIQIGLNSRRVRFQPTVRSTVTNCSRSPYRGRGLHLLSCGYPRPDLFCTDAFSAGTQSTLFALCRGGPKSGNSRVALASVLLKLPIIYTKHSKHVFNATFMGVYGPAGPREGCVHAVQLSPMPLSHPTPPCVSVCARNRVVNGGGDVRSSNSSFGVRRRGIHKGFPLGCPLHSRPSPCRASFPSRRLTLCLCARTCKRTCVVSFVSPRTDCGES